MSKELEALEEIKASHVQAHMDSGNIGDFDVWFEDYYKLLEQSLTPPTKEEVCKALSQVENLDDVKYCKHKKEFYILFKAMQFPISRLNRNNGHLELNYSLPPDVITMIGRFYEGMNEE